MIGTNRQGLKLDLDGEDVILILYDLRLANRRCPQAVIDRRRAEMRTLENPRRFP